MTSTSPLRYPGGKTRFTKFILSALSLLENPVEVFVEPFCGGAGVSIALLEAKKVQRIAINDIDPLVSSFWKIVFGRGRRSRDDLEWLIKQIESADISLDEWRHQKSFQPNNIREAAWKCLFLNRTSFNGIIHKAGPIGGWGQINRTLDVRFNRDKLVEKILKLNDLRMQVDRIDSVDWRRFCNRYNGLNNSYIYLDPPYYHRAEQLYGHLFDEKTHRKMRNFLRQLNSPWLLSYDDAPEVRILYGNLDGIDGRVVDQTYSTHPIGGASFVGRELVFSNRQLPQQPVQNEQRPHVGITVVGPLNAVFPGADGPHRTPIAARLLTTETL
jgi:DNA adenine methylase